MGERTEPVSRPVAFRWLAVFFLRPPSETDLENYRTRDGRLFLHATGSVPALARAAEILEKAISSRDELRAWHTRFAGAFSQAFDVGGPKSAPPYASVYLSERGLLCQQPTRDMNRILLQLQMNMPDDLVEPADHLGVQLNVAAELAEREAAGLGVPVSSVQFLRDHVLNWLPQFMTRCAALPRPQPIHTLAQAVFDLSQTHVEEAAPTGGRRDERPVYHLFT